MSRGSDVQMYGPVLALHMQPLSRPSRFRWVPGTRPTLDTSFPDP